MSGDSSSKFPGSGKPTSQFRDRIRELRRVRASQLRPNPKNWRKHPNAQQKAMRAALREIGFADALLAREDEHGHLILIDGHLRADLAPDTLVPVQILDVTEAEADKILATLDPLAAMADADLAGLSRVIEGIDFDDPEFGYLLKGLVPSMPGTGERDENAVPDLLERRVTKPGDLWILGRHRLLCGSATDAGDVDRVLGGVKPNLMVTDAPYGVNCSHRWRNDAALRGAIGYASRREGRIANDNRMDWSEAYALFPGSVVYIWHASLFGSPIQNSIEQCGFELRSQIIWAKSQFVISRGHYHWQHECCFYAVRKRGKAHWYGDRSQSTLWAVASSSNDEDRNDHPTQKPVELMRRPILNHTHPGECVYDPFVGTGTTIIAAETTGRICQAIEIDPAWVDVGIRRWQAFTGKSAVLETDGRSFPQLAMEERR